MTVTLFADHQAKEPVDDYGTDHQKNILWFSPRIEKQARKKKIDILQQPTLFEYNKIEKKHQRQE